MAGDWPADEKRTHGWVVSDSRLRPVDPLRSRKHTMTALICYCLLLLMTLSLGSFAPHCLAQGGSPGSPPAGANECAPPNCRQQGPQVKHFTNPKMTQVMIELQ